MFLGAEGKGRWKMWGEETQPLLKVLFSNTHSPLKNYLIWAYFIPLVSVNTHTEEAERQIDCLVGLFRVLMTSEGLTEACSYRAPGTSVPFRCNVSPENRDRVVQGSAT